MIVKSRLLVFWNLIVRYISVYELVTIYITVFAKVRLCNLPIRHIMQQRGIVQLPSH